MEGTKDRRYMAALIFDVFVALVFWVLLIALKAAGLVGMHWALVLSGIVWISWSAFALTALAASLVWLLMKMSEAARPNNTKKERKLWKQSI